MAKRPKIKVKAFTIIELVIAISILAVILASSGVIFKFAIKAHRTATASAEVMQKLRAITDQLNKDFQGLQKDGYLILDRNATFSTDRIYYFSAGDFQSWIDPDIRSNIARIYFGHAGNSLASPAREWVLVRDVLLLTPGQAATLSDDWSNISYAQLIAKENDVLADANDLFNITDKTWVNIKSDPNTVRRLMCENVGKIIIEWTDGTRDPADSSRLWWGGAESQSSSDDWPKALKFTFTLYDSKGIFEQGRTFTHIVYIGEQSFNAKLYTKS